MVRSAVDVWRRAGLVGVTAMAAGSCADQGTSCPGCDTVVIAATGEPPSLLPPLVYETVGRDIGDLVFERLATLAPEGASIDTAAYRPGMAASWERVDSLSWRFHLRPNARWHDGRPVTAEDVVFSFEAYADAAVGAVAQSSIAGQMTASAEDDSTVLVRFRRGGTEQLYDATHHVRVFPKHVWDSIPRAEWPADTSLARLVGSGPYRPVSWTRGQHFILAADTAGKQPPEIRRLIWRFARDADAALNLVLAHEADLMESIGTPDRVARVAADSGYRTRPYPAANYGFLAFRHRDARGRPHPTLSRREVRRGLTQVLDRQGLARAFLGPGTEVPPGPMSQLLWIWSDDIDVLEFDSAAGRSVLRSASAGPPIDILVPSTSPTRRQFAQAIQEAWRRVGVPSTVTAVEFTVFQERLAEGRFDAFIGAYGDEPSPRGLADQWSRSGWGVLNHGRYANPSFDSLLDAATAARDVPSARRLWHQAMDTLTADAAAIFLYAPVNVAAVHRRLENVSIDPFSWLSGLPDWGVSSEPR
ncbi:MAG: ABC transporter substrate-binding protein [Gemmatimonadales bacterium]|nr:ABC transporter substrate-binding protein [Gemmatimonadales bacterium]